MTVGGSSYCCPKEFDPQSQSPNAPCRKPQNPKPTHGTFNAAVAAVPNAANLPGKGSYDALPAAHQLAGGSGVALSGGGSRAQTCSMGELRALDVGLGLLADGV